MTAPAPKPVRQYSEWTAPFELMRHFSEDANQLFSRLGFPVADVFEWPFAPSLRIRGGPFMPPAFTGWIPAVDIFTRGDDLVVTAELAGITPEEVKVEFEDNMLIIRGETHVAKEDKQQGYWHQERRYGSYYRAIPLPPGVPMDQAQAEFKNGVLEVVIPGAVKGLEPARKAIPVVGGTSPAGAPVADRPEEDKAKLG